MSSGRVVVLAADGSPGSRDALRWALESRVVASGDCLFLYCVTSDKSLSAAAELTWYEAHVNVADPTVQVLRHICSCGLSPAKSIVAFCEQCICTGCEASSESAPQQQQQKEQHGPISSPSASERRDRWWRGHAAQLLVISSRGLGTVSSGLLGSVSDYCAQRAVCPVAVVRRGTLAVSNDALDSPSVSSNSVKPSHAKSQSVSSPILTTSLKQRHILLPVDGSEDSEYAVKWALRHLWTYTDQLTVITVEKADSKSQVSRADVNSLQDDDCLPISASASASASASESATASEQKTDEPLHRFSAPTAPVSRGHANTQPEAELAEMERRKRLISTLALCRENSGVHIVLRQDDNTVSAVGDVIVKFVNEAAWPAPDMVVLASRGEGLVKRALLGSVTSHCVRHCNCPVVIVRRTQASTQVLERGRSQELVGVAPPHRNTHI